MTSPRLLSIAPMMGYTDRYFRALLRVLCPPSYLYTEMITAAALVRREPKYIARLMDFSAIEHPVALQLGGSNPKELAQAAKMGEDWGYDEINLNVGCPSSRVQSGNFGACLMKDPELVADCVAAMNAVVGIPVTVKTRVGVDALDNYDYSHGFINTVRQAGCDVFIVHARKAWLTGLNPKQNRCVPELQYNKVYQLKADFPELEIIINGGIRQTQEVQAHLEKVDGVMIGRPAYQNPRWLSELASALAGTVELPRTLGSVIAGYQPVVEEALSAGVSMVKMAPGLTGLCRGMPGAKGLRRRLFDPASSPSNCLQWLSEVAEQLSMVPL